MNVPEWEMALRLGAAAVLGGLLGLQREVRGREAGLRTHMLLALGASLFALVSTTGFDDFIVDDRSSTNVVVDPGRIASYVAAGVGFLGGGTILKRQREDEIKGLTTAASLWVAAAIGVACGLGLWVAPAIASGIALVSLAVLHPISKALGREQ